MAHWLLKEEPKHYAWSDLVRDGRTRWNGVHNALALRHLRAMRPGDTAFYYHSGSERAVVGIVRVVTAPRPDPDDPRGSVTLDVEPVRPLKRPVSLAELRDNPAFSGFLLLRLPRLSVVPVATETWDRLLELGASDAQTSRATRAAGSARERASGPRRPRRAVRRRR